jgi:chromosome segregation protein
MRIKSIELLGFKSFYEKTTIQFQDGINAIVGPNGCGKSNILDAIRWVLGEQNPRRLRADGMEEVVSNGGETSKPLGMAEVSLTLIDVPHKGYDEVVIKRRLYRSGEGEYYINGTLCRLKDITEMFLDTGAGARAYSTVDQGKVEHLITAKPEEKRALIEEAAGIVRYKVRRRETERKIESTKENLRRLRDVMDEIDRQMDSLSRQARDAEEFKRLSEEARELELRIIFSKLHKMEEDRNRLLREKTEIEVEVLSLSERLKNEESHREHIEGEVQLVERKLEGLGKEIYDLKSELQAKEALLELVRSEVSGIDEYIKRLEKEIESMVEENDKIDTQINLKKNIIEEVKSDLSLKANKLKLREATLSGIKAGFTKDETELESTRSSLFQVLDKYSSLRGSALGYEKEVSELQSRRQRVNKEIEEVEVEKKKTLSRTSELRGYMSVNEERRTQVEERKKDIGLFLSSLNAAQESKRNEMEELSERFKEIQSRLNVLRQIETSYEWLPDGMRRFLHEKKGNGILGVVADFITVPKGYERALEAGFGDKLKWALVEESEEALNAVEYLRELSLGRGTFVPINNVRKSEGSDKNGKEITPLSDIVEVRGIDKDIIDNMLANVFVVSSLREALDLKDTIENGASFVTMRGDMLDHTGAITGGLNTEGVFERKREIEELTIETKNLEALLSGISREMESNQEEVERLQSDLRDLENELIEIEIKGAEIKTDISNLQDNLSKINMRHEVVEFDLKEIDSDILETGGRLKETLEAIKRIEGEKVFLEEKYSQLRESVQKSEEEERGLEREITDLKVEIAAYIEKEKSIEEDMGELLRRRKDIIDRIELEAKEIEEKKQDKLNLIKKEEDARRDVKTLLSLLSGKDEELLAKKNQKDGLLSQIKNAEEDKERLREEIKRVEKELSSFDIQLNSIQIEMEHLKGEIQEKGLFPGALDDNEALLSQIPDDVRRLGIGGEEAKLKRLKEKIEKFGPVNLLAPEEYKNLEERAKFLTAQNEDLVNAISSLKKAMNKIDRESEKRFNATFEVLDKKFQEVFRRLFRGGEAKLVLTNSEDLLETGVDVMVRPRGKRFQSVSLLSGGEKALSAIALVLSVCFIKPAPFLLLDEIDAPLDDVNTAQITDLLEEATEDSQVIIITHNKKTMKVAKTLVGITSDGRSASKVVSVELRGT